MAQIAQAADAERRHDIWKERLLDPKFILISELYQHKLDFNEFGKLLYNFFRAYHKEHELLKWVIAHEVKNATTSGVLFREESVLTRLMAITWSTSGGPEYLVATLKTLIDSLRDASATRSLEVDALKTKDEAEAEENCKIIISKAEPFMRSFAQSVHLMPVSIRFAFKELRDEVGQRFSNLRDTIVASMLFVRFLCPAIVSPQLCNLTPDLPTGSFHRALIIVSKLFASLANGVLMQTGTVSARYFNEFISENASVITRFTDDLVALNGVSEHEQVRGSRALIELAEREYGKGDKGKEKEANGVAAEGRKKRWSAMGRDPKEHENKKGSLRHHKHQAKPSSTNSFSTSPENTLANSGTAPINTSTAPTTSSTAAIPPSAEDGKISDKKWKARKFGKDKEKRRNSLKTNSKYPDKIKDVEPGIRSEAKAQLAEEQEREEIEREETFNALLDFLARVLAVDTDTTTLPTDLALSTYIHSCSRQIKRMKVAVAHKDWKPTTKKRAGVVTYIRKTQGKDHILFLKTTATVPASLKVLYMFLTANPSAGIAAGVSGNHRISNGENGPTTDAHEHGADVSNTATNSTTKERPNGTSENESKRKGSIVVGVKDDKESLHKSSDEVRRSSPNITRKASMNKSSDSVGRRDNIEASGTSDTESNGGSSRRSGSKHKHSKSEGDSTASNAISRDVEECLALYEGDKACNAYPFQIQPIELIDAFRGDYHLVCDGISPDHKKYDFCCTGYNFTNDTSAYCCYYSTFRKDCPAKPGMIRGELHPSGYIVEEVSRGGSGIANSSGGGSVGVSNNLESECQVTFLLQMDMTEELDQNQVAFYVQQSNDLVRGVAKRFEETRAKRRKEHRKHSEKEHPVHPPLHSRSRSGPLGLHSIFKYSPKKLRRQGSKTSMDNPEDDTHSDIGPGVANFGSGDRMLLSERRRGGSALALQSARGDTKLGPGESVGSGEGLSDSGTRSFRSASVSEGLPPWIPPPSGQAPSQSPTSSSSNISTSRNGSNSNISLSSARSNSLVSSASHPTTNATSTTSTTTESSPRSDDHVASRSQSATATPVVKSDNTKQSKRGSG